MSDQLHVPALLPPGNEPLYRSLDGLQSDLQVNSVVAKNNLPLYGESGQSYICHSSFTQAPLQIPNFVWINRRTESRLFSIHVHFVHFSKVPTLLLRNSTVKWSYGCWSAPPHPTDTCDIDQHPAWRQMQTRRKLSVTKHGLLLTPQATSSVSVLLFAQFKWGHWTKRILLQP